MTDTLLQHRQNVLGSNALLFYEEPMHFVRGEGVWLYNNVGVLLSMVGRGRNVMKIRPPLVFQSDHADLNVET